MTSVRSTIVYVWLAAAALFAAEPRRTVAPAWTAALPAPPRWAATAAPNIVVVATRDGRLHAFNAATGSQHWLEPPRIGAAAQLVDGADAADFVCVFDRTTVRGLALDAGRPRSWLFGIEADPSQFPDDPDVLDGWQVVTLTRHGLLAANRDGTVVLLDTATGTRRWQVDLPRWATVAIVHREHIAIVLAQRAGRTAAWRLDLSAADPEPEPVAVGPTWPIWSALTTTHLLLASPDGIRAHAWGDGRDWHYTAPAALHATGLALWHHAAPDADADATDLLLIADNRGLAAIDVTGGESAWRVDWPARKAPDDRPLLSVAGDRAWLQTPRRVLAVDLHAQRPCAIRSTDANARIASVHIADDRMFSLAGVAGERVDPPASSHWQLVVDALASSVPRQAVASRLRRVAPSRAVCWTTTHLVIVAADGLSAFPYPERAAESAAAH